jgi:hypothetical protein
MTGRSADDARQRADEAGARAAQLRTHLDAAQAGTEYLRGSSADDLSAARSRAAEAAGRLRRSLESSADAHDRAADGHEAMVRLSGDPNGTHAGHAADHRRSAAVDRERAAQMDPEGWQDPVEGA